MEKDTFRVVVYLATLLSYTVFPFLWCFAIPTLCYVSITCMICLTKVVPLACHVFGAELACNVIPLLSLSSVVGRLPCKNVGID